METLMRLLDSIEAGREPKPDWISLQSQCRLDKLSGDKRKALLARIHGCVLRGFRANNVSPRGRKSRLAYWCSVARSGFHDYCEDGWRKCYDSPFVHDYDYITPYLKSGLDALDAYNVYSSVLGTHDYGVEDFVNTQECQGVETIVEPMSGTAEFSYHGHFHYPDFRYVMFDLDPEAKAYVEAKRWLPGTQRDYIVADVLDEAIWQQAKSLTSGKSLCYLGKQSHHFFGARDLYRLMDVATQCVDYFILEVPEPSLVSDLPDEDELTRPEMEDAGFQVALIDEPGTVPNPLTNALSFRLDAWDTQACRTLFRYGEWTSYQHPMVVMLAHLIGLRVHYFDSEENEFIPVEDHREDSDCLENVTFLLFTRLPG
jgi:hypothetical protein